MRREIQPQKTRYAVTESFGRQARICGREAYDRVYAQSIEDQERFWADKASELLTWQTPWDKTLGGDFEKGRIAWFQGGKLNVFCNCLDRHILEAKGIQGPHPSGS